MVTGASTADLAVILIDARKGVLTQTRRHSYLVSLLGIRHVVLAVNKMDLVDYSHETSSTRSSSEYRDFAAQIGLEDIAAIPISGAAAATTSPSRSANTPWYHGPTLMGYLETVEIDDHAAARGRSACRCSGSTARTSTSAASPARSPAASCSRATRSACCPPAARARVARIVTVDGDLPTRRRRPVGHARRSPTRSTSAAATCIARADAPPGVADQFEATVVWMADEPMLPGPPVLAEDRHASTVTATVTAPKYKVNVNTLEHLAAKTLELNEIGVCNLVARPADRVRPLRGEPRHRRLHPDRPHDQRTRSAPACCTSRCAARRTSTGRRST